MTEPHYRPDTYRVRDSVGYLVRRASTLLMAKVEASFAEHELTFVQWVVLALIRDGLARTAGEISRDLSYNSGALTRVLDQLQERGLIERRRSEEDRRVVELALTSEGAAMAGALSPLVVDCLNRSLAGFSHAEVETLVGLLDRLVDGLSVCESGGRKRSEANAR